ncbi:MAG: Na+/H+ antiporter NhaC family protein [Pasteurellaceae bacterium]|nr:Na+/H+ antiporter NhaC family protein [Pasteurellaceae bacterium]
MQLADYSLSLWSILPAVLALGLAIATRRVLISLSIGILVGALMLANFNPIDSVIYIKNSFISLLYNEDGINTNNICIILFLLLLGILTSLLTVSGSNQAFANWAQQHIKGRRGAKLMAACLVFITFIDDYFHSLAVGAIARPVTDKFKVSRAKLAYILDSTAAPMCVLMPVSSWGAYIITLIAGLLAEHHITGYSPIGAFMAMSAMNFYAIFSIIMVFVVAYFAFDIGRMAISEKTALESTHNESENDSSVKGRVRNLIVPILVLILVTVSMMIYTGAQALSESGKVFSLLGAFENTVVGISLVIGGSCAVIVSSFLIYLDRQVSLTDYIKSLGLGLKSMQGAILILFFAWMINNVVGDMQTGKYLSHLISGNLNPAFLPALLFLIASAMAFATGTSWGTFGIMLPIAASIAVHAAPDLLLPCLSAVMAGAVCGDHCSPVSDTTILSSTGAKCNHMEHVTTQLPYAGIVASSAAIGYLVVGFSNSGLFGFLTTGVVMFALIMLTKKQSSQ